MAGKRIEDLPAYGAIDTSKNKKDLYEVSKNIGTYGAPIYDPTQSNQKSLEELAIDIASALPGYIPVLGENYLAPTGTDDDAANGEILRTAVTYALASTPFGSARTAQSRFAILLTPGIWNLNATALKGLTAIDNYIDIIGLGDAKDITIICDDADGTIEVKNGVDYVLRNLTIKNTVGNFSIFHAGGSNDNGNWNNLILQAGNTEGTNFNGRYENLYCPVPNILNGNIGASATVINSRFSHYSCGSTVGGAAITVSGLIKNCQGGNWCFGASDLGAPNVTISGVIQDCQCTVGFGFGATVTISGLIERCIIAGANLGGFGRGSGVNISGKIKSCSSDGCAFGTSNGGPGVNISGIIDDCVSAYQSFGFSLDGVTMTSTAIIKNCRVLAGGYSFGNGGANPVIIDGVIKDCVSQDYSFGCSSVGVTLGGTSIIENCYAGYFSFGCSIGGGGNVNLSGAIKNCEGAYYCFGSISGVSGGTADVNISGTIFNSRCVTGFGFQSTGSPTGVVNISGAIIRCIANTGFGCAAGTVNITGKIKYCFALASQSFGFSGGGGGVVITGLIDNCVGVGDSFGMSGYGVTIDTTALIKDCIAYDQNCFGSSGGGASVTIHGVIRNCKGSSNSFGKADGNVTIDGQILNCEGAAFCFGFCQGVLTIDSSAIIKNCKGENNCFGSILSSSNATVNVNGKIMDCQAGDYSFCIAGSNGTGIFNGLMKNCIGTNFCFSGEYAGSSQTINGRYINCTGQYHCFGNAAAVNLTGSIINCTAQGYSFVSAYDGAISMSGLIKDCIALDGVSFCYNDGFGAINILGVMDNCICYGNYAFGASPIEAPITFYSNAFMKNCFAGSYSFLHNCTTVASSAAAPINCNGIIDNCKGIDYCFVSSSTGSGGNDNKAIISNIASIINCFGNSHCFSDAQDACEINGYVFGCVAADRSFGFSAASTSTISGKVLNCTATDFAFCYAGVGTALISGFVENCSAGQQSFAGVGGPTSVSGTISNCNATVDSFGATTAAGKLVGCRRTGGANNNVQLGTIDRCNFSENDAITAAIRIGAGAVVKYSTFYQQGAAEAIDAVAAVNASVYLCAMNKTIIGGNITNLIATPNNVIDANIVI